jgi:hypothetical protein
VTRYYDVGQLSTAELTSAMRELRANLGLLTPDSPAHVPVLAHMRAIDAELAGRAGNRPSGGHPPAAPLLENRTSAVIATGRADRPMTVSRHAENDPAPEILARVREALLRL